MNTVLNKNRIKIFINRNIISTSVHTESNQFHRMNLPRNCVSSCKSFLSKNNPLLVWKNEGVEEGMRGIKL